MATLHNNQANGRIHESSHMWWGNCVGGQGGAVYMTSVPGDWAGVVIQKPLANAEKANTGQTN